MHCSTKYIMCLSITIGLKIKLNSGLDASMHARNTNTTKYKIEMLIHTL